MKNKIFPQKFKKYFIINEINAPKLQIKIEIEISGKILNALIDTGSPVCVLDAKFSNLVQSRNLQPVDAILTTTDNQPLNSSSMCYTPIYIQNKKFSAKIYIVDGTLNDLIIGMEFLKYYKAKIDLGEEYLRLGFKNNVITLPLDHQNTKIPINKNLLTLCNNNIKSSADILIPPRKTKEITLSINNLDINKQWKFQTYPYNDSITTEKEICGNQCTISVHNYTTVPQKIYKNQKLGELIEVEKTLQINNLDKKSKKLIKAKIVEDDIFDLEGNKIDICPKLNRAPVSYTHLTLPTIYSV